MRNHHELGYYSRKVLRKYIDYSKPFGEWRNDFNRDEFNIALKKDQQIHKAQEDRYYELLRKYVPMIWD